MAPVQGEAEVEANLWVAGPIGSLLELGPLMLSRDRKHYFTGHFRWRIEAAGGVFA